MTAILNEALQRAEILLAAGRPMQAAASLDRAEQLGAPPDDCAGRRWTCYMLAGNYEAAWQQSDAIRARGAPDPHRVWDGTPIAGKRVLVRSVHGFGDAIQMLRYAPLLRSHATRLTIQMAPELVELARCMPAIDEVVPWGQERPYDTQLEITELPYLFRTTVSTLPATMPYLRLSEKHEKVAREILGQKTNPRVGLVWSSSGWDPTRSIPFDLLRPLLQSREDLEFWCLQPHAPNWDKFCRKRGRPVRHAGKYPSIIFAACINEMDLVITTDSFAAHLAGALGRSAWVLLKQQPDWRWMLDREDSPWYPTLHLLRQQTEGDWKPVVAAATRKLLTWSEDAGNLDQSFTTIAPVPA